MSSAAGYTNSGDVLAQEQVFVYPAIGRQPASEMERSGIELRTARRRFLEATARERDGVKRNRAAHCEGKVFGSDSPRARWSEAESSCALRDGGF
ncbi:MAG: hypothetical protein K2L82_18180 [Lachnospiraceae bacterium]|nr:hypothetical protein [Lachnospiraceae bacterium]